jgi:tetratricopeptide (TPR) repeat protein
LLVDPLSPIVNQFLAEAYLNAGQTEKALAQVESLLDMQPGMRMALSTKGWCLGMMGDWQQAAEIFEQLHRELKHPLKGVTPLGCVYALMGQREKALECIEKINQRLLEEPGMVMDADLAMVWWALGDIDKTFHYLFQCVEKRMGPVAIFIDHPMYKELRTDPRYRVLKEKLGLTDYEVSTLPLEIQ